MKNKLVVIGWLSIRTAYLNVEREEAIRRWMEKEQTEERPDNVDEIEFDDEFGCYDVYSS